MNEKEKEEQYLFLCECYDYLQAKADKIKKNKPNMFDILTLTLVGIDQDIKKLTIEIGETK